MIMKSHHISPLIKAGFTIATIAALLSAIGEYCDVMSASNDRCLAILKMIFTFVLVYGFTYITYLIGIYFAPKVLSGKATNCSDERSIISADEFENMVAKMI